MLHLLCLSLLVIFTREAFVQNIDYCKIKCRNDEGYGKHTMCVENFKPGGGEDCKSNEVKITSEEIKELVDYINERRNLVALGKYHNLPNASNMVELHWDEEGAEIAKRWAEQCKMVTKDQCRKLLLTSRDDGSQCLASLSGKVTERLKNIRMMVDYWFGKGENMTEVPSMIDIFQSSSDEMGYFTLMAWAQTDRIGCGFAQLKNERTEKWGDVKFKLVCNLYPKGNINGRAIYKRGIPCSACPPKYPVCSIKHQGLCTNKLGDPKQSRSSRLKCLVSLQILLVIFSTQKKYIIRF